MSTVPVARCISVAMISPEDAATSACMASSSEIAASLSAGYAGLMGDVSPPLTLLCTRTLRLLLLKVRFRVIVLGACCALGLGRLCW